MTTQTIDYTYAYPFNSTLTQTQGKNLLSLATSSETLEFPYFFNGRLLEPVRSAQQLLMVTRIAGSRFYMPPAMAAKKVRESDPVVTSGAGKLRFESFSQCCGVYCRLDLLENAVAGTFMEQGTTNVDFNRPMRDALSRIRRNEEVMLSVGCDHVELEMSEAKVLEHKVDLPFRWYKGFVEVQAYASTMRLEMEVPGPLARRFLQNLPRQVPAKSECYLVLSKSGLKTNRRSTPGSVKAGGIERLVHLAPIAKDIQKMCIYSTSSDSVTCFELVFPESRLHMIISPYACRGFSGEGQVLQQLLQELDEATIDTVRLMIKKAVQISPEQLAWESSVDQKLLAPALAALGSRGLIGFDQHEGVWFYREFPFRPAELRKMHPRLEGARKLVATKSIEVIAKEEKITEAYVQGSGVKHRVRLVKNNYKCTCKWFTKNQGKQGACKHILAVQLLHLEE